MTITTQEQFEAARAEFSAKFGRNERFQHLQDMAIVGELTKEEAAEYAVLLEQFDAAAKEMREYLSA